VSDDEQDDEQLVGLVTRYAPFVDDLVKWQMRAWDLPRDDVDDVASEVLLTASRLWLAEPHKRVPEQGWPGWLTEIARNHIRNVARKVRKRRRNETPLEAVIPHPRQEDRGTGLDAVRVADLSRILVRLGEPERSVLLMVVRHGLTVSDAADVLDLDLRTVRRALRSLRDKVERVWQGGTVKGERAAGVRALADTLNQLGEENDRG
jgi:RNA polymerase sigma factor (sigma-70 family)